MIELRPVPKPSFNRRVKKRGDRSKFSKMVRDEVKEYFDNKCQMCGGKGIHLHHVQPKGSGIGRGVYTNALLLCNNCHKQVHADDKLLRKWKEVYRKKFGPLYFMDADDLKMKYLTQELREEDRSVKEWEKHNEKVIHQKMDRENS
jgi:predicted restriction endonuclease